MTGAAAKGAGRPGRERDRYRRASRGEQVADGLRSLRRNPRALLLLVVVAGGWLFFQLTAPRTVQLEGLSVGSCLHVPTSSNDNLPDARPVGTPDEVAQVLASQGADEAPCDASHSHEVAAVFTDTDPVGAPYPGGSVLAALHEAACETAFTGYVGHPLAGSAFEVTVVVQAEAGWNAGRRAGACLVSSADGRFLASRAGGSGR